MLAAVLAPPTLALSVRELELDSYLGQPFLARIPVALGQGEQLEERCLRLLNPEDSGPLASLRLSWRPAPGGGVIYVRSLAPVTEPIFRLTLSVGCDPNGALQREFVAFLDPESFQTAPQPPEVITRPLAPSAAPARRATYPRLGGMLETRGGESLNDIARHYFPVMQSNRDKLILHLQRQYPDLPQDRTSRLAAGLKLKMPTRNEVGALWPGQEADAATDGTSSPLTIGLPSASRGSGPHPDQTLSATVSRDRLVLSSPLSPSAPPSGSNLNRLEHVADKLLTLSDDQHAELGQLQHRLQQMEKQLKHMSAYLEEQQLALDREKARGDARERQVNRLQNILSLLAVLVLAALLLVLLLRWWERRRLVSTVPFSSPPSSDSSPFQSWLSDLNTAQPPTTVPEPTASFARKAETTGAFEQLDDVEVIQPTSVLEQAMLFAECGLPEKSIELLRQEIALHPAHVAAWMSLFRLLHAEGMVEEFRIQALEFRSQFASEGLWNQVSELGKELAPNDSLYADWAGPDSSVDLGMDMLQGATTTASQAASPLESVPPPLPREPVPETAPPPVILDVPLEFPQSSVSPLAPPPPLVSDEPLVFELPELQLESNGNGPWPPATESDHFPIIDPATIAPPPEITVDTRAREQSNTLARVAEYLGRGERQQAIVLLEQLLLSGNWLEKQESLRLLTLLRPIS
ncbi:type IV pilus assembly protein FimV [Chitinimonas lacunae]|uniref:FimV family protein n=1 Tax=Chitinimonas lacunae TaxID=1963018 RepID=A0ABV8MSV2_9NEIS